MTIVVDVIKWTHWSPNMH